MREFVNADIFIIDILTHMMICFQLDVNIVDVENLKKRLHSPTGEALDLGSRQ